MPRLQTSMYMPRKKWRSVSSGVNEGQLEFSEEFHESVKSKRLSALGLTRAEVEAHIAEREKCRAEKQWTDADRLRDELLDRGISVMDSPAGTPWRVTISGRSAEGQ